MKVHVCQQRSTSLLGSLKDGPALHNRLVTNLIRFAGTLSNILQNSHSLSIEHNGLLSCQRSGY